MVHYLIHTIVKIKAIYIYIFDYKLKIFNLITAIEVY